VVGRGDLYILYICVSDFERDHTEIRETLNYACVYAHHMTKLMHMHEEGGQAQWRVHFATMIGNFTPEKVNSNPLIQ
jgi:hypothetical protein